MRATEIDILGFLMWVSLKYNPIIKNMHNFSCLLFIGSHPMWPHTFEKKKVMILGKKIVLGKISVIGLTQINFNP